MELGGLGAAAGMGMGRGMGGGAAAGTMTHGMSPLAVLLTRLSGGDSEMTFAAFRDAVVRRLYTGTQSGRHFVALSLAEALST